MRHGCSSDLMLGDYSTCNAVLQGQKLPGIKISNRRGVQGGGGPAFFDSKIIFSAL
jgi:hypothetical protein